MVRWGGYKSGVYRNNTTRWRPEKDGSRTCTHCGSLHPDDFIDVMWRYSHREEGYSFGTTTKGYKLYGNRPGVVNAGDGGIKFYSDHLPDDRSEFDAAYDLARVHHDFLWDEQKKRWAEERK